MKKITLCLIILTIVIKVSGQDKHAILNVMDAQKTAWNRGDIPGFMQGYWHSDSLLFVGAKGPTYGWQKTLDNYKSSYPNTAAMGTLNFYNIKITFLDATNAFVLGGWQLKREKDMPGGYFTLWFKKIKGEWKIVVDHTS